MTSGPSQRCTPIASPNGTVRRSGLRARRHLPGPGAEALDEIAIDEADVTVLGILAEGTR